MVPATECFGGSPATVLPPSHAWRSMLLPGGLLLIGCARCGIAREILTWAEAQQRAQIERELADVQLLLDDVRAKHGR